MRFPALAAIFLLFLSGCAALPPVDADIAQASRTADPRGALDLMRRQNERIAQAPFLPGNAVTLLRNGRATYAAMTAAIDGAHRRIDMESYTFDDVEGGKFADLLLGKRAEGLEVNLIYDGWGSIDTSKELFDRLQKGGVKILQYHPVTDIANVNDRDHRKLLVVDAAVAIVGGVNISEVYENRRKPGVDPDDSDNLPWRDTDIRLQGPVVAQFERMFMETWHREEGAPISEPPPTPETHFGTALVQGIDGDPNSDRPLIYKTLLVAITLARSSIHLTTGYFVPTPDLAKALRRAAERGVDVEIVVPGHSDSSLAVDAGRSHYGDLLESGVQIFERQGAVLHAKTAVIDGAFSIIGSSNLDWRSVVFNNEDDAIILDDGFGREMEVMFQGDLAASHRIDLSSWRTRPFPERFREWRARLLQVLL